MGQSVVNSKGQFSAPRDIRARVKWKEGTRLLWCVLQDGSVLIVPKLGSIEELAGCHPPRPGGPVTIEEMRR